MVHLQVTGIERELSALTKRVGEAQSGCGSVRLYRFFCGTWLLFRLWKPLLCIVWSHADFFETGRVNTLFVLGNPKIWRDRSV